MTTIGLVGCGRWGKLIARDLVALGTDVVAVCRDDTTRANAQQAGVDRIVTSVAELGPVDGVVVATQTSAHSDAILEAAALKVPIFTEKPMTNNVEHARMLLETLGDRLFVMDKWRYHHGVLALREVGMSGRLGPIQGVTTSRVGGKLIYDDIDATWALLPHELVIGFEILGSIGLPRSASAVRNGTRIVQMTAKLGDAPWHQLEVSSIGHNFARQIELVCELGQAWIPDPYADHIALREWEWPENQIEKIPVSIEMPLLAELAAFVAFVRGQGPPPKSSAAEGLVVVETIDALCRMSDTSAVKSAAASA